jgi:cytochrome c553
VIARNYLVDKSFYRFGHYRGDAPAEIAADVPIYKGPEYCQPCHAQRVADWSAGAHGNVVRCETCHGAAALHPVAAGIKAPQPADERLHAKIAAERFGRLEKLSVPADSVKLCTLCHEKIVGRPAFQKQIEVDGHARGQQCIACHNPHSPRISAAAGVQRTAAVSNAKKSDAAAGRTKAAACAACHGKEGTSVNPQWPNLAGQQSEYLTTALKSYRSGTRPDPLMTGQAKALNDSDIDDLAAYFAASRCRRAGPGRASEQAAAGKAKAAACTACHGERGVSGNPAWPSLAGQQPGYLAEALKAYRDGARAGTVMSNLAKALTDADIGDLAAYYAGLSCK